MWEDGNGARRLQMSGDRVQRGSERPRGGVALTIRSDREPWPRSALRPLVLSQNSRDDDFEDPIAGRLETTERRKGRSARERYSLDTDTGPVPVHTFGTRARETGAALRGPSTGRVFAHGGQVLLRDILGCPTTPLCIHPPTELDA